MSLDSDESNKNRIEDGNVVKSLQAMFKVCRFRRDPIACGIKVILFLFKSSTWSSV